MPFKFKRKISRILPFLLLLIVLIAGSLFSAYEFVPKILRVSILSPIGKGINYKENSIEDLLSKKSIQFDEVLVASDSSYLVRLKDDGEVAISSQKDLALQISSLQLILSRLTIEGKKFKRLDLRFDKPVIEL